MGGFSSTIRTNNKNLKQKQQQPPMANFKQSLKGSQNLKTTSSKDFWGSFGTHRSKHKQKKKKKKTNGLTTHNKAEVAMNKKLTLEPQIIKQISKKALNSPVGPHKVDYNEEKSQVKLPEAYRKISNIYFENTSKNKNNHQTASKNFRKITKITKRVRRIRPCVHLFLTSYRCWHHRT